MDGRPVGLDLTTVASPRADIGEQLVLERGVGERILGKF
jgi:hypothetical protein